MATIKENINKPDYKLLSGLVQGTEDELKEWSKKETRTLNADVGPFVTRAAFTKYENELAELVRQIKEGRDFYLTEKETWHDAPVTWTTDYPSQHKAYREKIYALKVQYAKLIAEQNHLKEVKAEKERAARRASRPTPTTPTAKKSGWWKHALAYGILGTTLLTAWLGKGDKSQTQSGSSTRDGTPPAVEQSGNTFSAPKSYTDSLRDRLEQARLARLIAEEEAKAEKAEQAKINGRLNTRQKLAYTQRYEQEQGQEVVRGQAWTAREVSSAKRQVNRDAWGHLTDQSDAARRINANNNSMRRDTSGTHRQVRQDYWNR